MNPTPDMVQRRLETVASGTYRPDIPGLDSLLFVKMGLKEKGMSSRAYSSKVKELYAEGGYFSEALIPSVLAKACQDNGLDIKVLDEQRKIQKRFYEKIPEHLKHPFDSLTEEEVNELPEEKRLERAEAIDKRSEEFKKFMDNFYTPEDIKVFDTCKQIEQLETHLKSNTVEHNARKFQMETEILLCARKTDNPAEPYFSSNEEVQYLEDENFEAAVQLFMKWKQFKEGLLPDYFRPDNLN